MKKKILFEIFSNIVLRNKQNRCYNLGKLYCEKLN